MTLDTETFQVEIDAVLDVKEAEKETAAGVRGAEMSEKIIINSEDVGTMEDVLAVDTDSEANREETEAEKVLGDEESTKDSTTDTDDTPVQFNDTTLAKAVSYGITLTEAKSFPDNAALARFVDSMESNLLPPPESEVEQAKDDDEPGLFDDLPKLNSDDYSPEVIQILDRYKEVLVQQQEQIAASSARTDSVNESVRGAGEAEMAEWYDKAVAGLGDDYKDALGDGAFASLNGSSKHFENRNDIAGKMAVMHAGYTAHGDQSPPREELFEMAVRMVLPNQQSGIERRKLAGELEKQATQHISRAGGAGGKSTRTPEEETAALLDKKYG